MSNSKKGANKAKNNGGMGRVVFYSIALIVACCAVAVVLFETEAGQKIVAKVRGKESSNSRTNTRANVKNTEAKQTEGKANQPSSDSEKTKQAESAFPREENVLNSDTSAKPSDNSNDAKSDEPKHDGIKEDAGVQEESVASEPVVESVGELGGETNEADIPMDESTSNVDSGGPNEENEEWEKLVEEMDRDEPVEEQEKPIEEDEKPIEEQDIPVVKMEKPDAEEGKPDVEQEKPVEAQNEEHEKPVEKPEKPDNEPDKEGDDLNEKHETEVEIEEVVDEKVKEEDGSETEEEESLRVGDSLGDLEKERTAENNQAKEEKRVQEERYEPISEPEGPPIDQSPVNARRGLRGDYGGKGTVFSIFNPLFPSGLQFRSIE